MRLAYTGHGPRHARRGPRRGFTLVELLVVMAVISILAALLLPSITKALGLSKSASCLSNLRQIGQAYTSYVTAWDELLICAGNRDREHDQYNPIYEDHWDLAWEMDMNFPYWYEVIQPYVNSYANPENVVKEYWKRYPDDTQIWRRKYREIVAELCGIYACPKKESAVIGYGYNYVAPFGNSSCYPNSMCPDFKWPYGTSVSSIKFKPYPCKADGRRWIIKILWYNQYVPASVITAPSQQILMCDTGKVTNDPRPDTDPVDPREWREAKTGTTLGYTRFPLNDDTIGGVKYIINAWRPVPRHGGYTCCLFFDGSAREIPILDVAGPRWADPKCLYDNKPPYEPAVSPVTDF
ncbi:MAG: type II secretion system protein [Candidatus Brocadiia bacterium]